MYWEHRFWAGLASTEDSWLGGLNNHSAKKFRINFHSLVCIHSVLWPSVLWRCWLGGRKGIRPVKNEWWGVRVVICLERDADLHTTQLMPLPLTVSCFSKIQIGFTFLVPAYPGCPGKEAVKWLCVVLPFWYRLTRVVPGKGPLNG